MHQSRVNSILQEAKYATIGIIDKGKPWVYSVSFVRHAESPYSLVYYSHQTSRHTKAVQLDASCALSIYIIDDQGNVDGLQAEGVISIIDKPTIDLYNHYYNTAFADPIQREEWRIDFREFTKPGSQRFHIIELGKIWLMDMERWDVDKADTRFEVLTESRN